MAVLGTGDTAHKVFVHRELTFWWLAVPTLVSFCPGFWLIVFISVPSASL